MAHTHVAHRTIAVQMLESGPQVNVKVAPVVVIIQLLFDVDVDTAQRVHYLLKAFEVKLDIRIRLDAEYLFDRLHGEVWSTQVMRCIDLVDAAIAWNVNRRIAWDRQSLDRLVNKVDSGKKNGIASPRRRLYDAVLVIIVVVAA